MGKQEDQMACVDSKLRVYGLEGLRVADLSVCPFTPKYVCNFQSIWIPANRSFFHTVAIIPRLQLI